MTAAGTDLRGRKVRIAILECVQEVSSFNPLPSNYDDFLITRGDELYRQRGLNMGVAGALSVLEADPSVEVVPLYSARGRTAGTLSASGWDRLSAEFVAAAEAGLPGVDGAFVCMHGAMAAQSEPDPEGALLAAVRGIVGERVPIVISLDLHGILTDRMLRHINGVTTYWTYPHVDFADTGARAARLLLRRLRDPGPARLIRIRIPALVRGDELITRSGCYGDKIRECKRLEADGIALTAGVMIGNPFTDVPELCSQVIVMTEAQKEEEAIDAATRLADAFWQERALMQPKLISLPRAIAQAQACTGPVVFTDAADATSSGASGDSNAILSALRASGYSRPVLAQIVDAPAAAAAHAAGVGATIDVTLGGTIDPERFPPMRVTATVRLLFDGRARTELRGSVQNAGPSAVLEFDNFTVVVLSEAVSLVDRSHYYAAGLDPRHFALIVVKAPHVARHMYDDWVEANFNIDAPGATSANVHGFPYKLCPRPIFPLEADTPFEPRPEIYPC